VTLQDDGYQPWTLQDDGYQPWTLQDDGYQPWTLTTWETKHGDKSFKDLHDRQISIKIGGKYKI
jgi:hypothetical protein